MGKAVDLGGHAGGLGASPQLRARSTGWHTHYVEAQEDGEAHTVHEHLRQMYQTGNMLPELPPWQSETTEFTEQELTMALGTGRRSKAVGADGTELLPATPGGGLSSP